MMECRYRNTVAETSILGDVNYSIIPIQVLCCTAQAPGTEERVCEDESNECESESVRV